MSNTLSGFMDMPAKNYSSKSGQVRRTGAKKTKTVKKVKATNMDKEQYKKAKATHKDEIARLKALRAKCKRDIKTHKLLMKQAKIVYKLSKIKEN